MAERWWELLPYTTHRYRLAGDLWTREAGPDYSLDVRARLAGQLAAGGTVLDLGCLEGGLAVEAVRQGAGRAVGVEAREVSWRRCELARHLTGLPLEFHQAEAMTWLASKGGRFDVVLLCGLLYHLTEPPLALQLLSDRAPVLILDTHVAREDAPFPGCGGLVDRHGYRGRWYEEGADPARRKSLWSAWDNARSFWPLEGELKRMLAAAGWGGVEEVHPPEGEWHVNRRDRVLWVCRH